MATNRYPPEAWARLARLIETERQRQHMSMTKVVQGRHETYQNLMQGRARDATLRKVEESLGLALFACDDVLGGSEVLRQAATGEPRDQQASITRRAYIEAGQHLEGLAAATPEEYERITGELARIRERSRQTGSN